MEKGEGISQHTAGRLFTRDFVLVFLAYFAFVAANHAFMPALPIYLAKLGSNERQVGLLVGIMGIAALVSRLFVGGFLRKHSKKSAMIFGAVLFAITFIAAIVLRPFWPFFTVRVFQGIAFASLHTAAFAYCVGIIPPAYWGQGIAYFMLAPNLAMALAAPFGIFLMNRYGFSVFFLTLTSLCLCSFFLSWKVKERKTVFTPEHITQAHSAFLIEWKIITPAIANFLQMFVFGAIVAFVPLYAVQCGIANPGLFFTANAVVIMTGRMFGGKILDTYDKEKMIMTFIFINMITMIILSFSKTLPMFIFVGLLWGTGGAFFMPASMAHAFEYAGSSNATAVGTFQAFTDLGMALGPAIMGMIVTFTGYPIMFLCLAFICFVDLAYFQFYVRKKHSTAATV
jgi:predicted MFS family arabinose efflux permease